MTENSIIRDTIYSGERIGRREALSLLSWDIHHLAAAADYRRKLIHPDETVGFILDRIINYTNVCRASCRFCAFHARAGQIDPYVLADDEILRRVGELVDAGGTQVMLQGGLNPDLSFPRILSMVRIVKERYPSVYLHSFSPSEVIHFSRMEKIPVDEVVSRLKDAGVSSIPGASDILVDRVRREVCPLKITRDEWVSVIDALHRAGMMSSATMTYGLGETWEERIAHLDTVRSVQDRTGIIMAFIPWSFSPVNTELSDMPRSTGMDYLRVVAISRIYLDNVRYIQAGWLTEGMKLAQIALCMGANDMGGVLTEEVVVRAAGVSTRTSVDEMAYLIRDAGKTALVRDSRYNTLRVYE